MRRFLIWYCILSPIVFALVATILGALDPGYDPLSRTVSEVVLSRYGWLEQVNLLQITLCFFILSIQFPRQLHDASAQKSWRSAFQLLTFVFLCTVLFPTDTMESMTSRPPAFSLNGMIHVGVYVLFILATPFGIPSMTKGIEQETDYRHLISITRLCGYLYFVLSIVFLTVFALGHDLRYMGIFQRIIIGIFFYWVTAVALALKRSLVNSRSS